MNSADLPAVHSHLDHALRHLEAASALTTGLVDTNHLTPHERFALNDETAEAGLLIDQLARTIAGPSLDDELAELLRVAD